MNERTDLRGRVAGIADDELLDAGLHALDEFVAHGRVHQEARARETHLRRVACT